MAHDANFVTALAEALEGLIAPRSIGEEWHSFTGIIPLGGVPYFGQMVTREVYSDLWDYVQSQGLVKTEAEWQTLATTNNGNVPYYSDGDGSTTFRMPKIVGYVKGASNQAESGSYIAEGLPNITGNLDLNFDRNVFNGNAEGAFYQKTGNGRTWATGKDATTALEDMYFDASRSNAIYGNSDHVTPETTVVMFGVYAFGAVVNSGEVDVLELSQNRIPVSGLRGVLAGYETVGSNTVIDGNAPDSNETGSDITVSNGVTGTSWTKTVRVTSEVAVTLGDGWTWMNGEEPTITAGGILVCIWCGSGGIAGFISP